MALLAAAGPWLGSRSALAKAPRKERVAVVATSSTPLVERFCAELRELGFEVATETLPDPISPSALEQTVRREQAAFAVGLTETPVELEFVGVDAAGAPLLHETITRDAASPDADSVSALRAAELTRASALGLDEERASAERG
ncbi:MAG TPA: hypothetical protein VGQ57_19735, partial [Polyangiaceae bacterium]|nr:hypothetical protein [Polyangiaceae bacterium]